MNSIFPPTMSATLAALWVVLAAPLSAQTIDGLEAKNASIAQTTFKGRTAIQVLAAPDAANATSYAIVKDASFRDGTIEVDLAGQPAAGPAAARAGSSASPSGSRPMGPTSTSTSDPQTAGPTTRSGATTPHNTAPTRTSTSPDRGRRLPKNTSRTWTWSRAPGPSTGLRWGPHGAALRARRGAAVLIVNDLKLEPRAGGVALWVGPGTEGYFSNLKITAK